MTKEELAAMLNGRPYRNEITKEECALAKESGLVVVYGASDDLIEFSGAINDEAGAGEDFEILFTKDGKFPSDDLIDQIKDELGEDFMPSLNKIMTIWCPEDAEDNVIASWAYQTDIPHAKFDIMEDGERYCIGIVFNISDLK